MSIKFVSKNSNYMIVLKPGIEGSRALGTHSIPGLYVKFQDGVVEIKDEDVVEMLRSHSGYGTDFLEIKEHEMDPFLDTREAIEPDHVTGEIKYGHVERVKGPPRKVKLTPELKKIVEGEALKMLPALLKKNPEVLKEVILGLAMEMKKEASESKEDTEKKEATSQKEATSKKETVKKKGETK